MATLAHSGRGVRRDYDIYRQRQIEVNAILENNHDFLEVISRRTFDYLWYEVNPKTGLVKDRSSQDSPSSVAAVGFALTAIPIGIERGWIESEEGYDRVLRTLLTFASGGVDGKNGFYYHFVDMNFGRRHWGSEVSSVDTAFFIAGALFVGQYFRGTEVERIADRLYRNVNWQWMMNSGTTLSMGWKPESGFLEDRWQRFDESMLMYILAIGSPTYPIDPASWDSIARPVRGSYISLLDEPLFVYQYSHIWIDFRNKQDKYANYWNNSIEAIRWNRDFTVSRMSEYKGYEPDIWGLSASDGPWGYRAYGAAEELHDGTIAPYASIASLPFTPEISIAAMKAMLRRHGARVWGKYGFISAFNVDANWFSNEHIGIDQGDTLLMIENYRSQIVWKYFMQNEYVLDAMKKIGFTTCCANCAITPEYSERLNRKLQRTAG